jgi:hypothetical protein
MPCGSRDGNRHHQRRPPRRPPAGGNGPAAISGPLLALPVTPRIRASGFSRSRPSATAQDTALRSRSQRADTFGTDTPSSRHRQIAARITAGVRHCRRQRNSGASSRVETTWRCETAVAGFHKLGAAEVALQQFPPVTAGAACLSPAHVKPYSATSSRRAFPASAASPCTVNDRWMLRPHPRPDPATTRTFRTPGLRSRSDPVPCSDRFAGYARSL